MLGAKARSSITIYALAPEARDGQFASKPNDTLRGLADTPFSTTPIIHETHHRAPHLPQCKDYSPVQPTRGLVGKGSWRVILKGGFEFWLTSAFPVLALFISLPALTFLQWCLATTVQSFTENINDSDLGYELYFHICKLQLLSTLVVKAFRPDK